MNQKLPKKFQIAIQKIIKLSNDRQYQGAFIFGSTARHDVTENSDLDVKIIVSNKKTCDGISHPFVNGKKLDVSFLTLSELSKETYEDIRKAIRIPMLAESIILFDKNNGLEKLKKIALKAKPKKLTKKDHDWIQFMIYHATNKAERHLVSDPTSSLLSLSSNLEEILKYHYQINRRWWLSNKRLLKDLRLWDKPLARLVEKFLITNDPKPKFLLWKKIIRHVAKPIGNVKSITETSCHCPICTRHLKNLSTI